MLALAPSAALLAGAPSASAATAPVHAAAAAASSRFASLAAIAVAPHSTTAFAFGRHGNATTSAPYALRHHGNRWSTLKMANPADSSVTAIAAGLEVEGVAGRDRIPERGLAASLHREPEGIALHAHQDEEARHRQPGRSGCVVGQERLGRR